MEMNFKGMKVLLRFSDIDIFKMWEGNQKEQYFNVTSSNTYITIKEKNVY